MERRTGHCTIPIKDNFYCWGGKQEGLPMVHDNEEKRKFTTSVDILNIPTFTWERKSTTGNPPAGVMGYACTKIENSIFYFGGRCNRGNCFHNTLYELNTLTNNWSEISSTCTTPDNVPMRKIGSGMISFKTNGENNLILSGGVGPAPNTTQKHSQCVYSPNYPSVSYTNEIHCMNLSTSPGIT